MEKKNFLYQNGSVVQLSISPDESHVAYALSNGFVEVFEVCNTSIEMLYSLSSFLVASVSISDS